MLVRTLLAVVNLGVLSVTLAVWVLLPAYSEYALYGCLGWVVAALVLMYSTWGNRRIGGSADGPTSGAPLAGGTGTATGLPPLDFCIYCAAPMPAGASRCPACGHAGARG